MKKKIILLVAALMIFATGVSASSLNGEYKGNPIVKLKSNGSLVDTGEVPAMIYDGNTMVPIAALRNLGAEVTWDPNTYSVNVEMKKPESKWTLKNSLDELRKLKVSRVDLGVGKDNTTYITYTYDGTNAELNNKTPDFSAILIDSTKSEADTTAIMYSDDIYFSVPTSAVRDFFIGKISSSELSSYYYLYNPNQISSTTNTSNTTPLTNIPTTTAPPDNTCQNLRDQYTMAKNDLERNSNPFSGQSIQAKQIFESKWSNTFAQAGCSS